ncbi:MAG TPA: DUF4390 domain-containing protein [Methylomirabilota bacterium]|nr:DUF4390 domain-containing protein [Methylomirabilota bacterium]
MRAVTRVRSLWAAALAAVVLAAATPAAADLRVSDLDVFLNDHELTVNVALLGAIGPGFHEGLQSGIPAHVRYTVELWQYNRYWRDSLLLARVVERALAYNVVTKEYKVTAVRGETRAPHVTRDLRDAQRVISEVRGLKLTPAAAVDPVEVIYVRVHAEAALNGENSFVTRMAGTAGQTMRQSEYRTLWRVQ